MFYDKNINLVYNIVLIYVDCTIVAIIRVLINLAVVRDMVFFSNLDGLTSRSKNFNTEK